MKSAVYKCVHCGHLIEHSVGTGDSLPESFKTYDEGPVCDRDDDREWPHEYKRVWTAVSIGGGGPGGSPSRPPLTVSSDLSFVKRKYRGGASE